MSAYLPSINALVQQIQTVFGLPAGYKQILGISKLVSNFDQVEPSSIL